MPTLAVSSGPLTELTPARLRADRRGAWRPKVLTHGAFRLVVQLLDFTAIGMILGGLAIIIPHGEGSMWSHSAALRVIASLVAMAVWASQSQIYALPDILRAWPAVLAALPVLAVGIGVDVLMLWLAGASWMALLHGAAVAAAIGVGYLMLSRLAGSLASKAALSKGHLAYRVAVVGPGSQSWLGQLHCRKSPFLSVIGHYDSVDGSGADAGEETGNLLARARRRRVDAIILCYPESAAARRRHAFTLLRAAVADIFMYDEIALSPLLPRDHPLAGFPLIPLQRRASTDAGILLKGAIDRAGGALLLVLLSPLLAAAALAIRLDTPGPVFFRQSRVGYNNRMFRMVKFRSMHTHMADHLASNQTRQGDVRVTRVGRVIRRFSIDELPQLLNVVRGDMSLVGPRPHAPGTNLEGLLLEHASPFYALRHRVLPGITGWAQINGSRGALCTPDQLRRRVRLDLHYIESWSVMLDLKIIVLTACREVLSRRAC